jgi:hypothetical protein
LGVFAQVEFLKEVLMFSHPTIDRSIVMAQYDLRGYTHPLGFRVKKGEDPKGFAFIPLNLIAFAWGKDDSCGVNLLNCTYEACLELCKRFVSACDLSEKEAIQLILFDIVEQSKEMKAKVEAGEAKPTGYLMPLEQTSWWGKNVLALAEAFEVDFEKGFVLKLNE